MNALTNRQQFALDIIRDSIAVRGYPPTMREIGERMGIRSTNGVNDHLRGLERKGFLTRDDLKSRGIRLLAPAHQHDADAAGACDCPESHALRARVRDLERRLSSIARAM